MAGDMDLSRREFMFVGSTSLLSLQSGGVQLQMEDPDNPQEDYQFQGVADLMGPAAARPEPGDPFFDNKQFYAYRYEATDTHARYFITQNDSQWSELNVNPQTQVDEVRVSNYVSFFNHTFARPNSPDAKNWTFTDGDVTKQESEVELASTTMLETQQRGNYPPGAESIPGVAFRVTGAPTAGRADAGYFTDSNGIGAGEDATDSYVFLRGGGTEVRVYRSNWNGYVPDGRLWASDRPVITRFPHLFYGGGDLEIRAVIHGETGSELRTLHTFTPDNVDQIPAGPPIQQPNLPVRFESDSLSGGALRANACHYEFGQPETETRINGEHFTQVDAGTTDWTPLLVWQKRPGWEMVNVEPLKVSVAAQTNPAKLELQLNPTLSNTSTSLPVHTDGGETAVEIVTGTVDSFGQRRWPGYVPAGQGSATDAISADRLTFNLPANQPVGLFAQGVGGTSTLSGTIGWEEFF